MSSQKHVTKAAGIVGFATLITRISGFLRDMIVAQIFGASMVADAFYVAFRIPNMLRRFVGEGSMTVAFVPTFVEERQHDEQRAWALANAVLTFLTLIVLTITLVGMAGAPVIIRLLAPGFFDNAEKFALTVSLTRLMFPYLFFICLGALAMGILNSLHHFLSSALAPAFLNICMISSLLLLSGFTLTEHSLLGLRNEGVPEPIIKALQPLRDQTIRGEVQFWDRVKEQLPQERPERYRALIMKHVQGPPFMPLIKWLAVGVALGGLCQLLFQLPALFRRGFRFRLNFNYHIPALRKIGRLWLPSLIGVAVHEIIVFISTILASVLPEGSVSYLYYANRLIEFPQGIFGVAIATAVLPTMSAQAAKQEYDQLAETLSFALRLMGFLTIPATVGLIVLRIPIITTLFERGAFTSDATQATAQALLCYAFGLFAVAGVRIMAPVFYALKDTTTPVQCAVIAFSIDIACSLHLMVRLEHNGLALATAIAAWVNLALLMGLLRKRLGHINWKEILRSESKILMAALIMGICCAPFTAQATQHLGVFIAVIIGGVLVYILCAALLKCEELQTLAHMVRKKLQRVS